MRPQLKAVHSPDVEDLESFASPDAERFGVLVQLMIGPEGEDGEEAFDVVICTPLWLAERLKEADVLDLRHHLLVGSWEWNAILNHIQRFLSSVEASSWLEVASIVARMGKWEFEDYAEKG